MISGSYQTTNDNQNQQKCQPNIFLAEAAFLKPSYQHNIDNKRKQVAYDLLYDELIHGGYTNNCHHTSLFPRPTIMKLKLLCKYYTGTRHTRD